MWEVLAEQECDKVQSIILLKKEISKQVSPLDNALFHHWKKAVAEAIQGKELTQKQYINKMMKCWDEIPIEVVTAQYHHCRLYRNDKP
jgi:hypothetical protein